MIVPDANLLIYASIARFEQHRAAKSWWQASVRGDESIGLTWATLMTFLRITTHPHILAKPMTVDVAVGVIELWSSYPNVHIVHPGSRHAHALRALTPQGECGDFLNDVHLAAVAWEHGGTVYSADHDFARIPLVAWVNPLD